MVNKIVTEMNRLILLFFFVLISCEPSNYVYVRNMADNKIEITVKYTNKHFNGLGVDSIWFEDKIFKDIKWNTVHNFTKREAIEILDSNSYRLTLSKNHTYLMEPKVIVPIDKIIVKYSNQIDTLIFAGESKNYNKINHSINVNRKGIYARTTIIDLK